MKKNVAEDKASDIEYWKTVNIKYKESRIQELNKEIQRSEKRLSAALA